METQQEQIRDNETQEVKLNMTNTRQETRHIRQKQLSREQG